MKYPKITSATSVPIVYNRTIQELANDVNAMNYRFIGSRYISPIVFNRKKLEPIYCFGFTNNPFGTLIENRSYIYIPVENLDLVKEKVLNYEVINILENTREIKYPIAPTFFRHSIERYEFVYYSNIDRNYELPQEIRSYDDLSPLSHPFYPSLFFTGKTAILHNKEIIYEYVELSDWFELEGNLYVSPIRPKGLDNFFPESILDYTSISTIYNRDDVCSDLYCLISKNNLIINQTVSSIITELSDYEIGIPEIDIQYCDTSDNVSIIKINNVIYESKEGPISYKRPAENIIEIYDSTGLIKTVNLDEYKLEKRIEGANENQTYFDSSYILTTLLVQDKSVTLNNSSIRYLIEPQYGDYKYIKYSEIGIINKLYESDCQIDIIYDNGTKSVSTTNGPLSYELVSETNDGCDVDFKGNFIESISYSGKKNSYTYPSFSFVGGKAYTIIAKGSYTFSSNPNWGADGNYHFNNGTLNGSSGGLRNTLGIEFYNPNLPYNSEHIYQHCFISPISGSIGFKCGDSSYGDNTGGMTVEFYEGRQLLGNQINIYDDTGLIQSEYIADNSNILINTYECIPTQNKIIIDWGNDDIEVINGGTYYTFNLTLGGWWILYQETLENCDKRTVIIKVNPDGTLSLNKEIVDPINYQYLSFNSIDWEKEGLGVLLNNLDDDYFINILKDGPADINDISINNITNDTIDNALLATNSTIKDNIYYLNLNKVSNIDGTTEFFSNLNGFISKCDGTGNIKDIYRNNERIDSYEVIYTDSLDYSQPIFQYIVRQYTVVVSLETQETSIRYIEDKNQLGDGFSYLSVPLSELLIPNITTDISPSAYELDVFGDTGLEEKLVFENEPGTVTVEAYKYLLDIFYECKKYTERLVFTEKPVLVEELPKLNYSLVFESILEEYPYLMEREYVGKFTGNYLYKDGVYFFEFDRKDDSTFLVPYYPKLKAKEFYNFYNGSDPDLIPTYIDINSSEKDLYLHSDFHREIKTYEESSIIDDLNLGQVLVYSDPTPVTSLIGGTIADGDETTIHFHDEVGLLEVGEIPLEECKGVIEFDLSSINIINPVFILELEVYKEGGLFNTLNNRLSDTTIKVLLYEGDLSLTESDFNITTIDLNYTFTTSNLTEGQFVTLDISDGINTIRNNTDIIGIRLEDQREILGECTQDTCTAITFKNVRVLVVDNQGTYVPIDSLNYDLIIS